MEAGSHASYARNGKVMLASAILLFLIVLIIIFFHTYGHWCCRCQHRRRRRRSLSSNRMHSLSIASHDNTFSCGKGLEPSILKSLPTFVYSSAAQRPAMECAVCLSEFEDEDEGRLLPYCNHAFHSHCIDIWFSAHSNCPLCRAPVRKPDDLTQPPKTFPPVCSAIESPVRELGRMEEGGSGSSSLLAPIACPRKPLELVSIAVELPAEKMRG